MKIHVSPNFFIRLSQCHFLKGNRDERDLSFSSYLLPPLSLSISLSKPLQLIFSSHQEQTFIKEEKKLSELNKITPTSPFPKIHQYYL